MKCVHCTVPALESDHLPLPLFSPNPYFLISLPHTPTFYHCSCQKSSYAESDYKDCNSVKSHATTHQHFAQSPTIANLKICPWLQHPEVPWHTVWEPKLPSFFLIDFISIEEEQYFMYISSLVCYFAKIIPRPKFKDSTMKWGLVMVPTHRVVMIKWAGGCISWIMWLWLLLLVLALCGYIAQSTLRFGSFRESLCLECGTFWKWCKQTLAIH